MPRLFAGDRNAPKPRSGFVECGGPLVTAGLAVVLLATLTVVLWTPLVRAIRHEHLRSSVHQFPAVGLERDPEATPCIRGKVVVLDRQERILDPVHSRLPDEIRAFSPDEVGTIAWLEWTFEPTHNMSGRLSGYYSTCKVTLVDRERNLIVGEQSVMGASSPLSRGSRYVPPGQNTAVRAEAGVANYLQNLPRR